MADNEQHISDAEKIWRFLAYTKTDRYFYDLREADPDWFDSVIREHDYDVDTMELDDKIRAFRAIEDQEVYCPECQETDIYSMANTTFWGMPVQTTLVCRTCGHHWTVEAE